ncbi:MAG: ATP-binding cassette domain-containing protein [Candidatus Bipolaricaulaceae bacterium]
MERIMEAVAAEDLTVIYPGGTRVLDSVSFTAPYGTIVGYLGPNGAGKTTTINVLTTVMPPTRGDAGVCGHNVRTQKAEIRKRIGVATQDLFLDPLISPYMTICASLPRSMAFQKPSVNSVFANFSSSSS